MSAPTDLPAAPASPAPLSPHAGPPLPSGTGPASHQGQPASVLVVGAGIAGLAAAWHLAQAGLRVRVLEAGDAPGGRMSTVAAGQHLFERGAQFLSSGYTAVPQLAAAVGLAPARPLASTASAVVRAGRPRRLRATHATDPLRSGLLGTAEWLRMGMALWGVRGPLGTLALNDLGAWADFDRESAATWLGRRRAGGALAYVSEPVLHGFYFLDPETTSAALALQVSAFGWRRQATTALASGMQSLPHKLAQSLPVSYGHRVEQIVQDGQGVRASGPGFEARADYLVCAMPAPHARRAWRDADTLARRLMETPYSRTINLGLLTRPGFRPPPALQNLYGLLVPRTERRHIAAIALEAGKLGPAPDGAQVINVMLSDSAAAARLGASDASVLADVLPELEGYLPGISHALADCLVSRWEHAMPCADVGHARDVQAYRTRRPAGGQRVFLAGDYLNAPFTDAAALSGQWAAQALLATAALPTAAARRD
ncbi:protoporphyrinogen/coproporphyrinogen oxidase [Cupriavidus sp. USMAHM13]|uniref:protoporphyrinogen/coproporphyrinogen oxidase n=1 Tax=Cupriavidus sp. USMAHM13 TaxID=1389192 RepID=UPI0009F27547|nr:FAD-dependent oxidoreductase [Cupriavidus sp. USMAHM13]